MSKDYKKILIELQKASRSLATEVDEYLNQSLNHEYDISILEEATVKVERLTQGENFVGEDHD